jgi:hypothetical protein
MADDDKHDHTRLCAQDLASSTECHTLEAQTIMLDAQNLVGKFADATERHTLCAQNTMLGAQMLFVTTPRQGAVGNAIGVYGRFVFMRGFLAWK